MDGLAKDGMYRSTQSNACANIEIGINCSRKT
jgi:hypothetical protein